METTEKLAIAAALRAYFIGIGHIDETTDNQCKTWYADYESYVMSGDESLSTFAYALTAELTVHTNCCCKVESDEFSDEECGENGCQEHREFTLMFADETEAAELAHWLTWGEGINHWILSKDKTDKLIYMANGFYVHKTNNGFTVKDETGRILKTSKTIKTCDAYVKKQLDAKRQVGE